jgi:ring-1,2-phenylacetyl-CoA epoxidase subunit PaaC
MTDDEFTAYQALAGETEDHRWAFGTGFTDPLEGIDTSVPDGVSARELAAYCLMLGDDALIYSHRLQQWMTRLPELEEETAIANIALDLLGQARMLLARAGRAEGAVLAGGIGRSEDQLAFFRLEHEFRNVRLAEHADADFAQLAGRLLIFSAWRLALFTRLQDSADPVLAAIAAKGAKELAYHRDYAAQWVIRLGDGTDLSHARMQAALTAIWPLVDELFAADPAAGGLPGVAADPAGLRAEFDSVLATVLAAATLDRPRIPPLAQVAGRSGRDGVHTEALGYVLAELQSVARADPGATW